MAKGERLLEVMQALRRHRRPVSAATLASETGVSQRTIYRDIAALQAIGADIDGEPGIGYILRPGFLLPPLMLAEEEIRAIALGVQWVSRQTDPAMARASADALAKIAAVLPEQLRESLDISEFHVGDRLASSRVIDLAVIRKALRQQHKLLVAYCDEQLQATERTIWPLAIGFVDGNRFVAAWCELRQDFRLFRIDRMATADGLDDRYPGRRHQHLARWRAARGQQRVP